MLQITLSGNNFKNIRVAARVIMIPDRYTYRPIHNATGSGHQAFVFQFSRKDQIPGSCQGPDDGLVIRPCLLIFARRRNNQSIQDEDFDKTKKQTKTIRIGQKRFTRVVKCFASRDQGEDFRNIKALTRRCSLEFEALPDQLFPVSRDFGIKAA